MNILLSVLAFFISLILNALGYQVEGLEIRTDQINVRSFSENNSSRHIEIKYLSLDVSNLFTGASVRALRADRIYFHDKARMDLSLADLRSQLEKSLRGLEKSTLPNRLLIQSLELKLSGASEPLPSRLEKVGESWDWQGPDINLRCQPSKGCQLKLMMDPAWIVDLKSPYNLEISESQSLEDFLQQLTAAWPKDQ